MEAYQRLLRLAHGADQLAQQRQTPLLAQHVYRELALIQQQVDRVDGGLAAALTELGAVAVELQILRDELRGTPREG